MNVTCNDRDRIFEDGTPAEWAALEAHTASCVACAEELRAWKALSAAASELRDYSDSPSLWPRIERALSERTATKLRRAERWSWLSFRRDAPLSWQSAAAGAFVLLLTVSAGWFYLHPPKPRATPLQANYREKLLVLDSAIDELRAQAGLNPSNAHLRYELLAVYQEKQRTLEGILEEKR